MAKRKRTKQQKRSTKHYTENLRLSNKNRIKHREWTQVLRKYKQFLLHKWHTSCYSYYKVGDKSRMRKRPDCDYKKTEHILQGRTCLQEDSCVSELRLLTKISPALWWLGNRIGGDIVSVLALNAVYRGFEPRSSQTKPYKIVICCFSAKHAALRRKTKDWLARNQDNVSEWGDMSIRLLLF